MTTDFRKKDIKCASNWVDIVIFGENKIRRFKIMFTLKLIRCCHIEANQPIIATETITTYVKHDNEMHNA